MSKAGYQQYQLTLTMRNVQATKDAGKIAGLEVERIVNEPTAAALLTVLTNKIKKKRSWSLSLGGVTLDVSIRRALGDGVS